jgi:hypothetical protein
MLPSSENVSSNPARPLTNTVRTPTAKDSLGNNRIPFGRIWVGVGWGGVSWGGVGAPSAQDFGGAQRPTGEIELIPPPHPFPPHPFHPSTQGILENALTQSTQGDPNYTQHFLYKSTHPCILVYASVRSCIHTRIGGAN